jgi:hypothetical protein
MQQKQPCMQKQNGQSSGQCLHAQDADLQHAGEELAAAVPPPGRPRFSLRGARRLRAALRRNKHARDGFRVLQASQAARHPVCTRFSTDVCASGVPAPLLSLDGALVCQPITMYSGSHNACGAAGGGHIEYAPGSPYGQLVMRVLGYGIALFYHVLAAQMRLGNTTNGTYQFCHTCVN